MRRDIDDALRNWSYDSGDDEVVARAVRARDGRIVVQIRIELGLLQMELEGRPDGTHPHGFPTVLDYLRARMSEPRRGRDSLEHSTALTDEERLEIEQEFSQYHHRRLALLSLHDYEHALVDADHTLDLLDFLARVDTDQESVARHERLRGLALYHRTQAAAGLAMERHSPEDAVDALREGIDRFKGYLSNEPSERDARWESEEELDEVGASLNVGTPPADRYLLEQLRNLEQEIRRAFPIRKTLRELLQEAVEREDYESAARLRDQIRHRGEKT